jgi:hypothetical protein
VFGYQDANEIKENTVYNKDAFEEEHKPTSHRHEDSINLGDSDGDKYVYARITGSGDPCLKYDAADDQWEVSHDGSSFSKMATAGDAVSYVDGSLSYVGSDVWSFPGNYNTILAIFFNGLSIPANGTYVTESAADEITFTATMKNTFNGGAATGAGDLVYAIYSPAA